LRAFRIKLAPEEKETFAVEIKSSLVYRSNKGSEREVEDGQDAGKFHKNVLGRYVSAELCPDPSELVKLLRSQEDI